MRWWVGRYKWRCVCVCREGVGVGGQRCLGEKMPSVVKF